MTPRVQEVDMFDRVNKFASSEILRALPTLPITGEKLRQL